MVKRKRDDNELELTEKLDKCKELQIKKDAIKAKIDGRFLISYWRDDNYDFLENVVEKYNLDVLSILNKIEDPDFLKNIPSQITRLRLMNQFNYPIDNIPDTIKYLEISSYFKQKINRLPMNLTHLDFHESSEDVKKIDSFPDTLICLKIPKYPHDLDNLPSGLKKLYVGKVTSVSNLPNELTHVTINSNVTIENIPDSVKELVLGNDFNQPVDNLPMGLKKLVIGGNFNHPLNNLPDSLERLFIGDNFNQPLGNLPNSLKSLVIGDDFNQPIHSLPSNLFFLELGEKFNSPIYSLGNRLSVISFGFGYEQDLDMLPSSVSKIYKETYVSKINNCKHKYKIFNKPLPVDKFNVLQLCFKYINCLCDYTLDIKIGNNVHNIILKISGSTYKILDKYQNVFESDNFDIKVYGRSETCRDYIITFKKIAKKNKK